MKFTLVSTFIFFFVSCDSSQEKTNPKIVLQYNFQPHENSGFRLLDKILVNFLRQFAPENPQGGNYCDVKITGEDEKLEEKYEKILHRPYFYLNSNNGFRIESKLTLSFAFTQMIFTTKTMTKTTSHNEHLNQNSSAEEEIKNVHDQFNINKKNFLDIRKLSFQCSTALVFLEREKDTQDGKLNFNLAENFIESVRKHSGNPRPEATHFIFIANGLPTNEIQRDFEKNEAILRLKYKTVIFTGMNSKNNDKDQVYILTEINPERKVQFKSVSIEAKPHGNKAVPKFPFQFCNLCGAKINAAVFGMEPYVVFNEKKQPILGYYYNALDAIKIRFNLTSIDEFGIKGVKQLSNGTWTGYVKDLIDHRLDLLFAMGAIFDRFPYLDFTTHLSLDHLVFYTAHPQISINWQAIFYPFDRLVWILIGISFIIIVPIFYLQMTLPLGSSLTISKNPAENGHRKSPKNLKISKSESAFYAVILPFCALLQGSHKIPQRVRSLYGVFLFYSIVLGMCYNSVLISFLSFPQPEKVPTTFSELSHRPDFTVTTMSFPGSAADRFFQESKSLVVVKIQERLVYSKNYPECVISAALEKKKACISWPTLAESIISKNLTLHPTFNPLKHSDGILSSTLNLVLPRYSKYYSGLNDFVGWTRDTGHLDFWKKTALNYRKERGRKWMMSQKDGDEQDSSSSLYELLNRVTRETLEFAKLKPFGLENFVVCFSALLCGLVLSLSVLLVELKIL